VVFPSEGNSSLPMTGLFGCVLPLDGRPTSPRNPQTPRQEIIMSDKDKELTEEQLEQATGGRKTASGELGANRNKGTRSTGTDDGGIFTGGGGGTSWTQGEELDPPYDTRG
jgi:hypothetical protein